MLCSLHHPATLNSPQHPNPATDAAAAADAAAGAAAPIGMDVVITQGSSAGLEALFRILLNPGDQLLLEEYPYAHEVEAHLLPMG